MSRPEKHIDWVMVDKFLEGGCLGTEIAAHFDMHPNTFYDRVSQKFGIGFTEYSTEKKKKGESILRMTQYLKAIGETKKGDNTLLIWLGKQRLDQKENATDPVISADLDKRYLQVMEQLLTLQSSSRIGSAAEIPTEDQ